MMKPAVGPGNGVDRASRQCWECLKRRLVCDYTLPHCKKCQKNGKECPGYDEQKPLQWVEPGKVTSRRRRKETPPKCQSTAKMHTINRTIEEIAVDEKGNRIVTALPDEYVAAFTGARSTEELERVFNLGDRDKIKLIISTKQRDEAQKMLRLEKDPIAGLERMLTYMELEDLPQYNLRTDACEVVQSVHYFNARIYPDIIKLNELAPNPHIMVFPMGALHLLPPSVHHILVCLSLNHFIYSLPADGSNGREVVAAQWSKIYQHRGRAIRELSQKIGHDKTRFSDGTITSVLMFLCIELQSQAPTNWRTHSNGLMRLFDNRGGIMHVYRTSRHLHPTIVIFTLIIVFANCTCPAVDQVLVDPSVEQHVADISEMYEELFPHCLCPPSLYLDMVRISYLRYEAAKTLIQLPDATELSLKARDILSRIEAFSPRDWAQPGVNFDEWLTIGSVYKYSIGIYCITSMQSLTLLPESIEMNKMLADYGDSLLLHLKDAFGSKRLKRFLAWPVVVVGVEAAHRGEAVRSWIEEALNDLSRFTGTNCPLKMRAILRRYWQREEPGWEECFSQPYAFLF